MNIELIERVKKLLVGNNIEQKRMFGTQAIMLNGKLLLCVSKKDLMVRVGEEMEKELTKIKGVVPMIVKERRYKGYILVDFKLLESDKDLKDWIDKGIEFNKKLI